MKTIERGGDTWIKTVEEGSSRRQLKEADSRLSSMVYRVQMKSKDRGVARKKEVCDGKQEWHIGSNDSLIRQLGTSVSDDTQKRYTSYDSKVRQ